MLSFSPFKILKKKEISYHAYRLTARPFFVLESANSNLHFTKCYYNIKLGNHIIKRLKILISKWLKMVGSWFKEQ